MAYDDQNTEQVQAARKLAKAGATLETQLRPSILQGSAVTRKEFFDKFRAEDFTFEKGDVESLITNVQALLDIATKQQRDDDLLAPVRREWVNLEGLMNPAVVGPALAESGASSIPDTPSFPPPPPPASEPKPTPASDDSPPFLQRHVALMTFVLLASITGMVLPFVGIPTLLSLVSIPLLAPLALPVLAVINGAVFGVGALAIRGLDYLAGGAITRSFSTASAWLLGKLSELTGTDIKGKLDKARPLATGVMIPGLLTVTAILAIALPILPLIPAAMALIALAGVTPFIGAVAIAATLGVIVTAGFAIGRIAGGGGAGKPSGPEGDDDDLNVDGEPDALTSGGVEPQESVIPPAPQNPPPAPPVSGGKPAVTPESR